MPAVLSGRGKTQRLKLAGAQEVATPSFNDAGARGDAEGGEMAAMDCHG